MSDTLKAAFEKASAIMSEAEQQAFARWLIDALEQDDKRWQKAFKGSTKRLEATADQVLEDYQQGITEPLHIDKL